jgi:hypothetical protein
MFTAAGRNQRWRDRSQRFVIIIYRRLTRIKRKYLDTNLVPQHLYYKEGTIRVTVL